MIDPPAVREGDTVEVVLRGMAHNRDITAPAFEIGEDMRWPNVINPRVDHVVSVKVYRPLTVGDVITEPRDDIPIGTVVKYRTAPDQPWYVTLLRPSKRWQMPLMTATTGSLVASAFDGLHVLEVGNGQG